MPDSNNLEHVRTLMCLMEEFGYLEARIIDATHARDKISRSEWEEEIHSVFRQIKKILKLMEMSELEYEVRESLTLYLKFADNK